MAELMVAGRIRLVVPPRGDDMQVFIKLLLELRDVSPHDGRHLREAFMGEAGSPFRNVFFLIVMGGNGTDARVRGG